jgi:hypothetical protein
MMPPATHGIEPYVSPRCGRTGRGISKKFELKSGNIPVVRTDAI